MMLPPITVVETTTFKNDADSILSADERLELISFLASNPESGNVMSGTGGVRKVRWARDHAGKSGGYRVIFYFHDENIPLFALMIYPKNEKDNISKGDRNELKKLVNIIVKQYKTR